MTKPTALATQAIRGRLPLVGGLAWLVVVDAAAGRCECAGWCGKRHGRRADARCTVVDASNLPLHVVPAFDGVTAQQAETLGPQDLFAVCRGCHDRWAAQPAKQLEATREPETRNEERW